MPAYTTIKSEESIKKIARRIDLANDEMRVAKLAKLSKDWQVKVALLTLKDVLREWRRK